MIAYYVMCFVLVSAFALLIWRVIHQAMHDFGGIHWYDRTETFRSGTTVYTCRVCGRCEEKTK